MSDPDVDQSIPEECTIASNPETPTSTPTHEASGSERDENEIIHSDPIAVGSAVHQIDQTNLAEVHDGTERDPGKTEPPDAFDKSSLKGPNATQQNDDTSILNEGTEYTGSNGSTCTSILPQMEEGELTTISQRDHGNDANLQREPLHDLNEKSDEIDAAKHGHTDKQNTAYCKSQEIEKYPQAEKIRPVDIVIDRPFVGDSQPNDFSTTIHENDIPLTDESKPSNTCEQHELIDLTAINESTMRTDGVPDRNGLSCMQQQQNYPLIATAGEGAVTEPLTLLETEHSKLSLSTLIEATEQVDNAFRIEQDKATKPLALVDASEVSDEESVTERLEHRLDEVLAYDQLPSDFPPENAITDESTNNQETVQYIGSKFTDHLSADNLPPTTISRDLTDADSVQENESLKFDIDKLNNKSIPESIAINEGTKNNLKVPKYTSCDTSDRLYDSVDDDLVQNTSEKTDECLLSAVVEDGSTSGIYLKEATSAKESDSYPGELITHSEQVVGLQDREEQTTVAEAYLHTDVSVVESKESGLSEGLEDSRDLSDVSTVQDYSQNQQLIPLDSQSFHEHFATEHHVTQYLDSEAEFHILSATAQNGATQSFSHLPLFQVSLNNADKLLISQFLQRNISDHSTPEKPETTEQHVGIESGAYSEEPVSFASKIQDSISEPRNFLYNTQPKQTELSTIAATFHQVCDRLGHSENVEVPHDMSLQETKQRSQTLDPRLMSTWVDIRLDPWRRAATLGRTGCYRRPKLVPKPAVNDDHLFPDSVTPSKVDRELSVRSLSVGLPEGTYDVPYIDDDAFLPHKLRDLKNQADGKNKSECSSEGGDWNWPNLGEQNGMWNHAHIADISECIPTPQPTPQQQRVPHKGKMEGGKEYIGAKQSNSPRKQRLLNLCSCISRQSHA